MFQNAESGCWYSLDNNILTIGNSLFSRQYPDVGCAEAARSDQGGLSLPFTELTAVGELRTRHYCVWDDLPLVYMPDYGEAELLTLSGEHWVIRSVKLCAFTDENDTLTEEHTAHLFARNLSPQKGELFFLENPQDENAVVIISETPDYQTAVLTIQKGVVRVETGGNALALGFCKMGECEALCRNYYRHARRPVEPVSMSNTWGDCNGFSRVCRDFVLREIDAAYRLGVDIVQIDDGWQTGSTADVTRRDAQGRREFLGDFWEPDKSKFPNGMREMTEAAQAYGIRVGMWFAPDSHNGFALLERDKAVLRKAYEEWGIRFFKLDMFWILSDTDRDRFLELLREIYSFGEDVAVQLDVTRNARMNYLCGRQYGTVFVENRYLRSGNSFPHRILRNLWMLGQYLPTSKFQFELVNPDLYPESYAPDDPFAPARYDMDYLFATVMLSNPLFWMEMQFLSEQRCNELERVMKMWKACRTDLTGADVQPIGEKPSGRSRTGFYVSVNGNPKYLLLFREVTTTDLWEIPLPASVSGCEVLATNAATIADITDRGVRVCFSKPRAYAFLRLDADRNEA